MVQGQEIPIFYQQKAPGDCCIVIEEGVELKVGTEVFFSGKLEPGFERNDGTPGILEGPRRNAAEKLTSRFCVAHFSEQVMLLRPGQTVA